MKKPGLDRIATLAEIGAAIGRMTSVISFATDLRSRAGVRRFWEQNGTSFAEPFHGYIEAKLRVSGR